MKRIHTDVRSLVFAAATTLVLQSTTATADHDDTDWPYYGNDLGGMRYVDVGQMTPANVANLEPAWIFHTNVVNDSTSFESQPIIVDGRLFVTSPHNHVFALDAATGDVHWTYNPTDMPKLSDLSICCGQVNRGVAVGDGKVFVGQLDAVLVALNAETGDEAWRVQVVPWQEQWTITMAPAFADGKVFVGASGGEFLKRGFIDAYDAETGDRLWRFFTVPAPGEPGGDTWAGDSWMTGGATVWSTPMADAELGLLYITTGNPAPDLNGAVRAGDNLYSASVVALDLETGGRRWHFQEVHHDIWDYDAVQPVHLFDLERNGETIPALGHANKNGYYFILDRRTGEPLFEVEERSVPTSPGWQLPSPTQPVPATDPLIPQAVEVPTGGLPFPAAEFWAVPHETPMLIQPGFEAGPEWSASAYSPRTRFAYIQAGGYEPWVYHATPELLNSLGSTGVDRIPGVDNYGLFDAVDTTTGKIVWQRQFPEKVVSGVAVAGDLVFVGESNGKFNALHAQTGETLWTFQPDRKNVGGANGSPAVYAVKGRQYVVMAFGGNNQVRSSDISPPGDALIAFALPPEMGEPTTNVVMAEPVQIDTGAIPPETMIAPASEAPAGATVVKLETHDFSFFPDSFRVSAGERLAVQIVNTGVPPSGFAVQLPGGPRALMGPVMAGEAVFVVFTAPEQPGEYMFFSPLGPQKHFGMVGKMIVQ